MRPVWAAKDPCLQNKIKITVSTPLGYLTDCLDTCGMLRKRAWHTVIIVTGTIPDSPPASLL